MKKKHRCKHGEVISTFYSNCKERAGMLSWKNKGSPNVCPHQWYFKDCPKYEENKEYHA